jgi:hypothetical protein
MEVYHISTVVFLASCLPFFNYGGYNAFNRSRSCFTYHLRFNSLPKKYLKVNTDKVVFDLVSTKVSLQSMPLNSSISSSKKFHKKYSRECILVNFFIKVSTQKKSYQIFIKFDKTAKKNYQSIYTLLG